VRRFGAAALDLAYVAAGRYDGFWSSACSLGTSPPGCCWCVRRRFVSDLVGGQNMMSGGGVLAANGHLHQPLASLLAEAMRTPNPAA